MPLLRRYSHETTLSCYLPTFYIVQLLFKGVVLNITYLTCALHVVVCLLFPQHVIQHDIHDYNIDMLEKSYIMHHVMQ